MYKLSINLIILLLLFLPSFSFADQNTEEESYEKIMSVFKQSKYEEALEISLSFLKEHEASKKVDGILFVAGRAASLLKKPEMAIGHYKSLLKNHSQSDYAEDARADLINCYSALRQLEKCIKQAKENLSLFPKSKYADHWTFIIPHSQYRLYNFKDSKPGLQGFINNFPKSSYASMAKKYLGQIDPAWEIDSHGIVKYSGRFKDDIRLKARADEIPVLIEKGFKMIHDRLGVDLKSKTDMIFLFEETTKKKRTILAQQFVAGINNKPVNVIRLFTEKIIVKPEAYRKTLIHEMKHSGFKQLMGQSYSNLPEWVKEGLAVWAAEQVEVKMDSILNTTFASRKNPLSVLDGIDDKDHNWKDYLEDGLAFEWLESLKPGNVKTFCQRLISGEDYREIWADLAGTNYEEAMDRANAYCKKRISEELDNSYKDLVPLVNAYNLAFSKGNSHAKKWGEIKGISSFESWLKDNTESFAVPYARFCLGPVENHRRQV